jgi:hypothetical protein
MIKVAQVLMVWLMLTGGWSPLAIAGEQRSALLKQYWGTITSIRVDRCGKRPGLCEGAIVLTKREGGEVAVAIRPGTWIKRGERLVLLEDLGVGNDVHVQAIEIAAEGGMRATTIEVTPQR